jgi:DNA-binding NarL/FixJ family response regulator
MRRVLLVEDELLTRTLLASLLESHGFEVETSSNAIEASKIVNSFDPDGMVVDISLGIGPTGIDLIHAIKAKRPVMAFVVLSNYAAAPSSIANLQKVAYLHKKKVADPGLLIEALDSVMTGSIGKEAFPFEMPELISQLTRSQYQVLDWLSEGLSNQEIAARRKTTVQAVEQMLGRLYRKLGLKDSGVGSLRVRAASLYKEQLGGKASA